MTKIFLLIGSTYCMLSVMLGAFAAHGLKKHASEYAVDIFKTAAEYQMFHGLALILVCLLYTSPSPRDRQKSRMPSSA